jgi:hypothetical protein
VSSESTNLEECVESENYFRDLAHVGVAIIVAPSSNGGLIRVNGSMSACNFIGNNMPHHNDGPLTEVLEICVPFIRPEKCEQIGTHSTHGETNCM